MKVLILPDVHQTLKGLKVIKDNVDKVNKIVILGDMVDNWDSKEWWNNKEHNPIAVLDKYAEIVKQYPDKIYWLLGNHDLSYIASSHTDQSVSGHQWDHSVEIGDALKKYADLMDISVKLDGWVFSHAGFSDVWLRDMNDLYPELTKSNIIEQTNDSFHQQVKTGFYQVNLNHRSFNAAGDSPEEGPLWIRPNSLLAFATFNKQVIGHTEGGPYRAVVKDDKDKIKRQFYLLDNADHDCFAILDTRTNEIELLKGKLQTQELSWDSVKRLKKDYNRIARERAKLYQTLNFC